MSTLPPPAPKRMRAMRFHRVGQPLVMEEVPVPRPGPGQVQVAVTACGVCRTDLHVVDGDLDRPKLPLVPGHEIVGRVRACGPGVTGFAPGARVGIPWLGHTCGRCEHCAAGHENLCDAALFTGYTLDGGYADHCVADARYCFVLPECYDDVAAAPLLCAGLIGYRTLVMAGDAHRLGIMGFGAAAHILAQVAVWQGREIYAFTRPGDVQAQAFARQLGAVWAGDSTARPPRGLDAVIIFAPVGALVPAALASVRKGGRVVCGGIHMSDIPAFPYAQLWGERGIVSVANLTRRDGMAFFELAARAPVTTHVVPYALAEANRALDDLRDGRLEGAAVLTTA